MSAMYRTVFKTILLAALAVVLHIQGFSQNGEQLFKTNCGSCHKPDKDFAGPALKGWKDRVPEGDWIYKWVANPGKMIASDDYAKKIYDKWKPTVMTGFPQLSKADVDAILKYVDDYKAPTDATGGAGAGATETKVKPSGWLYGIIALVAAIILLLLVRLNKQMQPVVDAKDGVVRIGNVPWYRTKTFIAIAALLVSVVCGYFIVQGGVGLGRQQNYDPEQPIFYSHKVHAGTNQISCLYCHGGSQNSKQAGIPASNVCMNCHMSISKYTGPDELVRADGSKVDGTAEIQKLYKYAGWNNDTKSFNPDNDGDGTPDGSKPIPWVKIHNLPDHVYFNHSQHVNVGKQQCQTCHGNIQDMGQVYQFSDLSMGWCVNCHRTTKVNFDNTPEGNKYYSMFEKFHQDMKAGKMDSVTVEKIGGTECQKCHY